jgi:hypothetical protein
MGARFPKNTLFARMGNDDVPVICKRAEAYEWLKGEGGLHRVGIKSSDINGWHIHTQFQFYSSDPDFPLFWEVNLYAANPWRTGKRRFGIEEAGLAFHAALVAGEERIEELTDNDEDTADWWKA